ncbi:hypothetical protein [Metamycoplasma buccale]|uniref:hypothetical protein n=1 Tax=Metamycoplasma buccale TaxID=55602 RepID=UPI00398F1FE5
MTSKQKLSLVTLCVVASIATVSTSIVFNTKIIKRKKSQEQKIENLKSELQNVTKNLNSQLKKLEEEKNINEKLSKLIELKNLLTSIINLKNNANKEKEIVSSKEYVNFIAKLNQVNNAIKQVEQELKNHNSAKKAIDEEFNLLKNNFDMQIKKLDNIKSFNDIDKLNEIIKEFEKIKTNVTNLINKINVVQYQDKLNEVKVLKKQIESKLIESNKKLENLKQAKIQEEKRISDLKEEIKTITKNLASALNEFEGQTLIDQKQELLNKLKTQIDLANTLNKKITDNNDQTKTNPEYEEFKNKLDFVTSVYEDYKIKIKDFLEKLEALKAFYDEGLVRKTILSSEVIKNENNFLINSNSLTSDYELTKEFISDDINGKVTLKLTIKNKKTNLIGTKEIIFSDFKTNEDVANLTKFVEDKIASYKEKFNKVLDETINKRKNEIKKEAKRDKAATIFKEVMAELYESFLDVAKKATPQVTNAYYLNDLLKEFYDVCHNAYVDTIGEVFDIYKNGINEEPDGGWGLFIGYLNMLKKTVVPETVGPYARKLFGVIKDKLNIYKNMVQNNLENLKNTFKLNKLANKDQVINPLIDKTKSILDFIINYFYDLDWNWICYGLGEGRRQPYDMQGEQMGRVKLLSGGGWQRIFNVKKFKDKLTNEINSLLPSDESQKAYILEKIYSVLNPFLNTIDLYQDAIKNVIGAKIVGSVWKNRS